MKIKIILAVIILIASIFAAWQYVFPLYGKIKTLKTEIDQKQQTVQKLEAFAQKLEVLNRQYAENGKSIERLYKILPSAEDAADFINNADYLSFQSGMILGAVNFSKQAKQSKVAVSSGEEGAQNVGSQETASATAPDVILTDLSATGTYESFKNLLTGLEQNLRLADVQSISFAGKGESANLFEFKVAAKIYYKGL